MENIIDDLNYRGLIEQYSDEVKMRELLSTSQTIYCGFDPSASSMHLGNFVMGKTRDEAANGIRVSFSPNNTLEEVDIFLKEFDSIMKEVHDR